LLTARQQDEGRYGKGQTAGIRGAWPRGAVWSAACWRTRRLHSRTPIRFVLERVSYSEEGALGYPMKIANNLLAVVLENENDAARENFSVDLIFQISLRLKPLLQRKR
jgi:hypothetical protein